MKEIVDQLTKPYDYLTLLSYKHHLYKHHQSFMCHYFNFIIEVEYKSSVNMRHDTVPMMTNRAWIRTHIQLTQPKLLSVTDAIQVLPNNQLNLPIISIYGWEIIWLIRLVSSQKKGSNSQQYIMNPTLCSKKAPAKQHFSLNFGKQLNHSQMKVTGTYYKKSMQKQRFNDEIAISRTDEY